MASGDRKTISSEEACAPEKSLSPPLPLSTTTSQQKKSLVNGEASAEDKLMGPLSILQGPLESICGQQNASVGYFRSNRFAYVNMWKKHSVAYDAYRTK